MGEITEREETLYLSGRCLNASKYPSPGEEIS